MSLAVAVLTTAKTTALKFFIFELLSDALWAPSASDESAVALSTPLLSIPFTKASNMTLMSPRLSKSLPDIAAKIPANFSESDNILLLGST